MNTEAIPTKNRVDYIDEISGILIIVMVMVHITYGCEYGYYPFLRIFFFYMPWFFFKSGLFHKTLQPIILIKKTLRKFITPYVIFWLIGVLVSILLRENTIGTIIMNTKQCLFLGSSYANVPLWFLISLFVTKNLFNYLENIIKRIDATELFFLEGAFLISVILMVLGCFLSDMKYLHLPQWIAHNIIALGFYIMGWLFRERLKDKLVLFGAIILIAVNYFFIPSFVHMSSNRLEFGNYLVWCVTSVAACVVFIYLFRKIRMGNKILSLVGQEGMLILCTHWIIINILDRFLTCLENPLRVSVYIIVITIIEFILCRYKTTLHINRLV